MQSMIWIPTGNVECLKMAAKLKEFVVIEGLPSLFSELHKSVVSAYALSAL